MFDRDALQRRAFLISFFSNLVPSLSVFNLISRSVLFCFLSQRLMFLSLSPLHGRKLRMGFDFSSFLVSFQTRRVL